MRIRLECFYCLNSEKQKYPYTVRMKVSCVCLFCITDACEETYLEPKAVVLPLKMTFSKSKYRPAGNVDSAR